MSCYMSNMKLTMSDSTLETFETEEFPGLPEHSDLKSFVKGNRKE